MSTPSNSIESIQRQIAEAVAAEEASEQHRRKLAELLAIAWNASRKPVSAEA